MPVAEALEAVRHWVTSGAWMKSGRAVLAAIVIMAIAVILARLLRTSLERLRGRHGQAAALLYIVQQLGGYVILVVGFLIALRRLGLDLGTLTVFGGAVGVGLGLGLQGVVKEFVSGLVLILDPSVQVGDFVEVEGLRGEVAEIGPRATRLRTNDDLNVVIPNSELMQGRLVNWTYNSASRRIHVPFAVAEGSDKARVRDAVVAAAKALPFTLPDDNVRKTQVWLTGFSGAGLEFDLVVWPTLESSRHPRSMHAAYTWAIHEALLEAGIGPANAQMDLRLRNVFGREGEEAIGLLNLTPRRRPAKPSPDEAARSTTNDAAEAVFDDADRNRQLRADDTPRPRERPN